MTQKWIIVPWKKWLTVTADSTDKKLNDSPKNEEPIEFRLGNIL